MTIRTTLLSIINLLVLMVIIAVGGIAFFTWEQWNHTHRVIAGIDTSSQILRATFSWAVERGLTNGAIAANAPASSEQIAAILKARTAGDQAMEEAHILLRPLSFDAKDALLSVLEEDRAKVISLRQQADQDLQKPKAERSPLLSGWFPSTSQAIASALNLRRAIVQSSRASTEVVQVEDLRSMLATMAEFAGRERAYMNAIIAANRPSNPQDLIVLGEGNGQLLSAWHGIESLARQGYLQDTMAPVLDSIRENFFKRFGLLRGQVFTASREGTSYPVTPAEWFKAATEAIAVLNQGQQQTGDLLMQLIEKEQAQDLRILIFSLLGLVSALAIGLIGGVLVRHRVVRRLQGLHSSMTRLAEGDLVTEIAPDRSGDEIGQMYEAVQVFREAMIQGKEAERIQQECHLAREHHSQAVDQLTQEFGQSVTTLLEQVGKSIAELQTSAESMTASAGNTSAQSATVVEASRHASDSAHEGANATAGLTEAIHTVAGQVEQAATISQIASAEAQSASDIVTTLDTAVQKISTVVGLITNIASQTNLLALNATIEAARAGEAGKGFAVVAGEVKGLANQTAKATEEITIQINAVQDSTHRVVDAIGDIVTRITEISNISSAIAQSTEEQRTSADSITNTIHEVDNSAQTVVREISGVEESAATTGQSAHTVLIAAGDIRTKADLMQGTIDRFLKAVAEV